MRQQPCAMDNEDVTNKETKGFKLLPRMNGEVDDAVREREVAKEGSPKRSSFDWGSKPRKNEFLLMKALVKKR
jgi:hypothetical protein